MATFDDLYKSQVDELFRKWMHKRAAEAIYAMPAATVQSNKLGLAAWLPREGGDGSAVSSSDVAWVCIGGGGGGGSGKVPAHKRSPETTEQRWARIKSEAGLPAETDHAAVERIRQVQAEATAKRNAARLAEEQWRREHPEEDEVSEAAECTKCKQPFGVYRKRVSTFDWCGDCDALNPTPLDARIAEAQPKPEPERPGAWMTPTWDGEW